MGKNWKKTEGNEEQQKERENAQQEGRKDKEENTKTNANIPNAWFCIISYRLNQGLQMKEIPAGEFPDVFWTKQQKNCSSVMFRSNNEGQTWSVYKKQDLGYIGKILNMQADYLPKSRSTSKNLTDDMHKKNEEKRKDKKKEERRRKEEERRKKEQGERKKKSKKKRKKQEERKKKEERKRKMKRESRIRKEKQK